MKIKDLIPYVHEYVFIYGDVVDKMDMRYIQYGTEIIKTNQLIWSGYLYDTVPENIANLNIHEISVYHERPTYMELDNCDIGIEIYT